MAGGAVMFMSVLKGIISRAVGGGGGSPILTDLISWWSMDETSGSRADSHGTLDLSDQNSSVTSAAGLISNAADFQGSTEEDILETGITTEVPAGQNDYSISLWVYPHVILGGSNEALIGFGRLTQTYSNWNWIVFRSESDGDITWRINRGGTAFTQNQYTAISTGKDVWSHIYVEYEAATRTSGISVNNGTLKTVVLPSDAQNLSSSFIQIGAFDGAAWDYDGLIDEVAIWGRRLTVSERDSIYNSGNGLAYADL